VALEGCNRCYASRLKPIFNVLHSESYRLFFFGLGVSLTGSWMQRTAMSWLVYRLTNSAFSLGVVAFAGLVPNFVLAPLAGVVVDRWSRYRIIIVTQVLLMVQASILAFFVLSDSISIWKLIYLSVILGLINALDMPARQSFLPELIEKKEHLGNAIALNSFLFNGSRLIGPSLAGIIIASAGEGGCFVINAISYLAVIAALLGIRIQPKKRRIPTSSVLKGLKEGFSYAFGMAPIRSIILLLGLVNLIGVPCLVLMPVIAKDILSGGPQTLGFLTGASGVGALLAATYLAIRAKANGLEKIVWLGVFFFGLGLISFSLSRAIWLSMAFMVVIGFGMVVQMASSNTILQTLVDDDKRGRVMSFYNMAILGMAPFGSLLIGSIASIISTLETLLLSGSICILASFMLTRRLSETLSFFIKLGSQSRNRIG